MDKKKWCVCVHVQIPLWHLVPVTSWWPRWDPLLSRVESRYWLCQTRDILPGSDCDHPALLWILPSGRPPCCRVGKADLSSPLLLLSVGRFLLKSERNFLSPLRLLEEPSASLLGVQCVSPQKNPEQIRYHPFESLYGHLCPTNDLILDGEISRLNSHFTQLSSNKS
jgi:hypothetical protein